MTRLGERLKRTDKLLRPIDFKKVLSSKKRLRSKYFTYIYEYKDTGSARLGLAVAKKKIPKATCRNRIKRLIRESFRLFKSNFTKIDIVIMPNSNLCSLSNHELLEELNSHWNFLR